MAPLQCIVISLKDTFYTKADALVGVYKDQVSLLTSRLGASCMR